MRRPQRNAVVGRSPRKIAEFCGWELSPEKLQRVRARSSFEFMKQHESRFDPALETLWEQGGN